MSLRNVLLVVFFACFTQALKAQNPVAEFSGNVLSGCAPLTVSFRDLSTGNPRFWNWDFGNGQLSNQQNPTVSFSTPGLYSVTLVVRSGSGTNGITKTEYIRVNPSPRAAYSQSTAIACLPAVVNFTDASTTPNGSITTWSWNFGDGTRSDQQSPSHEYTEPGFYTVSLTVTDDAGCSSGTTRQRSVRIVNGVTADFLTTGPETCQPPYNISFRNQSSGPGVMTYNWDFGNGTSGSGTSPVVPYATDGTFNVTLLASSEFGCSDTIQKAITFSGISTSFSSEDTSCINSTVSFQNTSAQPALASSWYVNDVLFSSDANSTYTFNSAGVFNVKLVNQYTECSDSSTRTVTILPKPAVDFNANNTVSCQAPFSVSFQDQTPNSAGWVWDFGDGNSSTMQNPQHIYQSAGSYTVSLRVTDIYGCEDTTSKSNFITIAPPTVNIFNTPAGGCVPFTFSPVATVNAIDGVASYFWDLGNGVTSTNASPVANYTVAGNYDILLRITTNGGCTDSVRVVNAVRTGTPPTPNFNILTPVACAFGDVSFQNTSINADSYLWDFGDSTTATTPNPVHSYRRAGDYTVTLTAYDNLCPRSISRGPITIAPPVASFNYEVDCNNLLRVTFENESSVDDTKTPLTYLWSFGDPGDSTSSEENPSFIYPALGTYTVTLTVVNDTCTHTITRELNLTSELADFEIATNPVCKGEPLSITAINSDSGNIQTYLWQIGTNTPYSGGRSTSPIINTAGTYDLRLTITDNNGCTTTKTEPAIIRVVGPEAGFTVQNAEACANTSVSFVDSSVSVSPIVRWAFDFGDGTTQEFTAAPFVHTYADTGTYSVSLTVTDATGCTNRILLPNLVTISKPIANFYRDTTTICSGLPVAFRDSSVGTNLNYFWDFGDGSTSTDSSGIHNYAKGDGTYTVKLRVEDDQGCTDSLIRTDYLRILDPKPAFDVSDTMTLCPPLETLFTLRATDYQSYYWDFGDGTEISLTANPRHFYNSYGSFNAKLVTVGFGGCVDSATRTIYVQNPSSAVITYSPLTACNRLTVDFTVEPPPSTNFIFNFGDGSRDTSGARTFSHFYRGPGFYNPSITLSDATGCIAVVGGRSQIRVIGAQPLFGINAKEFCDTGTVFFTNYTVGNDPVVNSVWDFGDGNNSTATNEIHTYTQPGTFVPSLTVTTQSGCTDVITDTVRVYGTPFTTIQSRDTICVNSMELFTALLQRPDTSSIQYNWTLGDGQTSTSREPAVTYPRPGDYNIRLDTRVAFGCPASSTKTVHVVPLPGIQFAGNPTVMSGGGINLPVTYTGPIVNYNWTPVDGLGCTTCPIPFATPKRTTTYNVQVTDRYGCEATGEVTVFVVCSDQNLFVPNTFSPNGDGRNDRFYPRGTGLVRIKSLRIFNRWGETVFEKINFNANQASDGWDGRHKGKNAETDVYVYIIEVVCENGESFNFKGNVMLLK